ncbi:MAG: hypothetical protein Q4G03_11825 [Planctomycetia bacterium]|nr:hypothetical protein [Planctomycetia bacterium]
MEKRRNPRRVKIRTCVLYAVLYACVAFALVGVGLCQSPKYESNSIEQRPTFWLVDENGAWRAPLPNWTLEEVMKMVDSRTESLSLTPYSIQSVTASGQVADGRARLQIQIDANVAAGIVRMPLGLQEGVYIPSADSVDSADNLGFSYQGPGGCMLDVDPTTGEYIAVFQTFPRSRRDQSQPVEAPLNGSRYEESYHDEPEDAPETDAQEADAPEEVVELQNHEEASEPAQSPNDSDTVEAHSDASEAPESATHEHDAQDQTNAPAQEESAQAPEATPNTDAPQPSQEDAQSEENPAGEPQDAEPSAVSTPDAPSSEATQEENHGARAPRSLRVRPYHYSLTLDLSFTVETVGDDEYRFVASFPASVHSQLTLVTPIPDVKIGAVKGAAADAPTTMSESASELKLRGLGRAGERVEITWRKEKKEQLENLLAFQVEDALISAELDARETLYEATLPIRVFGGEANLFRVTLPPDALLEPGADAVIAIGANGATFELLSVTTGNSASSDSNDSQPSSYVEARLAQKTAAVTLKIKARTRVAEEGYTASAHSGSGDDRPEPRAITGFSVQGAQKQYGQIKIKKSEDSDFNVTPVYGATGASEASFEEGEEHYSFFSQPFLLNAERYKRETIVNVKPEYQTIIGLDSATLRARFQYSVYGSKASAFRIKMNGWNLVSVEPENLVSMRNVIANATSNETIFKLNTPQDGEVAFELTATRQLDAMPQPVESTASASNDLPEALAQLESPETEQTDAAPETNPDADADASDATTQSEPVQLWSDAELDADDSDLGVRIAMPLPMPIASRVETAALVASPEDDVAFLPDLQKSQGITQRPARSYTPYFETPKDAQQSPMLYQARPTAQGAPTLYARVAKLERKVAVDVKTDATISDKGDLHIAQTLVYKIEHEPLDAIVLQARARLFDHDNQQRYAENLKFFVDGKLATNVQVDPEESVAAKRLSDDASEKPLYAYRRIPFTDAPKIGVCVITVQYDLPRIDFQIDGTRHIRFDLFQPKKESSDVLDPVVTNNLTITTPFGVRLAYESNQPAHAAPSSDPASGDVSANSQYEENETASFWKAESPVLSEDGRIETLRCSSIMREFSARFSGVVSVQTGVTTVERAWIQSWFSEDSRVDRMAFRMNCKRDYIEFKLPEDVKRNHIAVSLNGSYLTFGDDDKQSMSLEEQILRVPIPNSVQQEPFVLELETSYNRTTTRDPRGRRVADFPTFVDTSVWVKRVYWQTIMAYNKHVVVDPRGWTPEFVVKRGGFAGVYQRMATMNQDELCDWIGIARREPLPQEVNVYLYSRFDAPIRARFYQADRGTLVLLGSGVALLFGLGLVYFPLTRSRNTLLLICVCVAALSAIRPLLALIFLQTTVLGVFLTVVVAVVADRFDRNATRRALGKTKIKSS